MLTSLLLLGLVAWGEPAPDPGGTAVVTPARRVIVFTQAGGFFAAQQQMDPADVVDFVLDLSDWLEPAGQFRSVAITVTAASALNGFVIMDSAPFERVPLNDRQIRIWASIAPEERGSLRWNSPVPCRFQVAAETSSDPPRSFERTGVITVVNK